MKDDYQSKMKEFLDACKAYVSTTIPRTEAEIKFVLAFHALSVTASPQADKEVTLKNFGEVIGACMDLTLELLSGEKKCTEVETRLNAATFNFILECKMAQVKKHV